ncbi:MAG: hypothetical protein ACM3JC_11330 [Rudaea sp.]
MSELVDFVPLLAAIDTRSLQAIIPAINELPDIMPSLQAWIEHAARWEYDRRNGLHYPLQGPMAALMPEEVPAALAASTMLGACFRHERRRDVSAVVAFFDGLRHSLAGELERAGSALH